MTVRHATTDDVPDIARMCQAFGASQDAMLGGSFDMARVLKVVHYLMDEHAIFVLVDEANVPVGLVAVQLFEHPFTGVLTASEVAWWVDPAYRGHGRKLLQAAESWATLKHCGHLVMVAPDTRVGRLYERAGYHAVESAYRVALPRASQEHV